MENSEIIDESESSVQYLLTDFNDEYEHYDETEDDYDLNEEDSYDDGIANSKIDDGYDDAFDEDSDETDSETAHSGEQRTSIKKELEDSLQESEDYDELDD